jgi:hypothetical protein
MYKTRSPQIFVKKLSSAWSCSLQSVPSSRLRSANHGRIQRAPNSPALSPTRVVWYASPHRTYRLISAQVFAGPPWRSFGAAVADGKGRVSLAEPATEAQRFWKPLEVE